MFEWAAKQIHNTLVKIQKTKEAKAAALKEKREKEAAERLRSMSTQSVSASWQPPDWLRTPTPIPTASIPPKVSNLDILKDSIKRADDNLIKLGYKVTDSFSYDENILSRYPEEAVASFYAVSPENKTYKVVVNFRGGYKLTQV